MNAIHPEHAARENLQVSTVFIWIYFMSVINVSESWFRDANFQADTRFDNTIIYDNTLIQASYTSYLGCSALCGTSGKCKSFFYNALTRNCPTHTVIFQNPTKNKPVEGGWKYWIRVFDEDCLVDKKPPRLLVATSTPQEKTIKFYIIGLKTNTMHKSGYISSKGFLEGITYDSDEDRVYFTTHRPTQCRSALTNGSDVKILPNVCSKHTCPKGLAIDCKERLLFIGGMRSHVATIRLDTGQKELIVGRASDLGNTETWIAIDPLKRMVYWRYEHDLERASYEGKNRKKLCRAITTNQPIHFDFSENMLYWGELGTLTVRALNISPTIEDSVYKDDTKDGELTSIVTYKHKIFLAMKREKGIHICSMKDRDQKVIKTANVRHFAFLQEVVTLNR